MSTSGLTVTRAEPREPVRSPMPNRLGESAPGRRGPMTAPAATATRPTTAAVRRTAPSPSAPRVPNHAPPWCGRRRRPARRRRGRTPRYRAVRPIRWRSVPSMAPNRQDGERGHDRLEPGPHPEGDQVGQPRRQPGAHGAGQDEAPGDGGRRHHRAEAFDGRAQVVGDRPPGGSSRKAEGGGLGLDDPDDIQEQADPRDGGGHEHVRPRRRAIPATAWLATAAPTTGGRKELSANSRVRPKTATMVTRARDTSASAGASADADRPGAAATVRRSRSRPRRRRSAGAAARSAESGSCSSVLIGARPEWRPDGAGPGRRRKGWCPTRRRRTGWRRPRPRGPRLASGRRRQGVAVPRTTPG